MMKQVNKSLAVALLALAPGAAAQDLGIKAPPQEGPIAIVNATIHPVGRRTIERGWILFDKGEIREMGSGDRAFVATTRVIDAEKKHVYPGLIGAVTQMGLVEISSVRATRDSDELGSITPEVRAVVAVNPDSTVIPVTRSNGILTVGVFPSGGSIPGRAGVIDLDGWTWEDMALETEAGLVVDWPSVRPGRSRFFGPQRSQSEQRDRVKKALEEIEDVFERARAYFDALAADPSTPVDIRFEAMRDVFPQGDRPPRKPVFLQADDYDQILSALSFAARWGLKPVIVGGRDAHLCTEVLKEHDAPVIVVGTHSFPTRDDSPYDEAFARPAALEEAGVHWCLATRSTHHQRNLPYEAATAAAFGLPREAALRSITLSAAEILGIDDVLGSLEPGKDATLIVTDGDPLEIPTHVELAFIQGREIDLSNKQTALDAKYREKYRQLGILEEER